MTTDEKTLLIVGIIAIFFWPILGFIYENWEFFAFCGFIIFVGFCIGLYRTYNQQTKTKKLE